MKNTFGFFNQLQNKENANFAVCDKISTTVTKKK